MDDKPVLKGAWSGSPDPFSISMPAIISPLRRDSIFLTSKALVKFQWGHPTGATNTRGVGKMTNFDKVVGSTSSDCFLVYICPGLVVIHTKAI